MSGFEIASLVSLVIPVAAAYFGTSDDDEPCLVNTDDGEMVVADTRTRQPGQGSKTRRNGRQAVPVGMFRLDGVGDSAHRTYAGAL